MTAFSRRGISIALSNALLVVSGAHAQESNPAQHTLPSVQVKADNDPETATGPVSGYRAKRSATATKTDTPLNEVPQSITVITADQVKDQNAQTMQEVLRYTSGVRNEMYGLDNRGDWFTLRGGSEGSVLLDGLRLPFTNGMRDEPFAFERIEVLRGPASIIAGQNGPGGVVNLVSKQPQAQAAHEVGVQLGNHHHKQISTDLTGALNDDGTLLYRLVALGKDSDTQVRHADERRTFVAPSLTWQPMRGTTLTAFAQYQKDHSRNLNGFFGIEGTLRAGPHGFIPIDTFIGEPSWDRFGGERERVGYRLEQTLNEQWTLRHSLRYDHIDSRALSMYAAWWLGFSNPDGTPNAQGSYLNRIWYGNTNQSHITNSDLLLEGKFNQGRVQHTVLAGIDAMRHINEEHSSDGDATPLDVYHPVYGSFPAPDWESQPYVLTRSRVRNVGLLLQDQIKFDQRWVVVAGLRRDQARTETNGSVTPQNDSALSKNLGLVYLTGQGWSPYVGYSESFEPVAGADFFGAAFKPKRGKQLETGVKWMPENSKLSASAAVYQLVEKNRLTTDPDPAHVNFSVQLGEVTVKGVELEVQGRLGAWDVIASTTYMDARQTNVGGDAPIYLDKQLSGIPRHSAALWAIHNFGAMGVPGLRAGAGARYTGRSSDGIDVTFTPSNTLFDAMVSYDTGPWSVALNVANLTDKTYIATCLERGDCWFGTKRKAMVSAGYRW